MEGEPASMYDARDAVQTLVRTVQEAESGDTAQSAFEVVRAVGEAFEVLSRTEREAEKEEAKRRFVDYFVKDNGQRCLHIVAHALSNDEVLDEFVRTGVAAKLVSSLREGILERSPRGDGDDGDLCSPSSSCPASLEAEASSDTGSRINLYHLYCVQCLACMGEYVECLGPILKDKGVEVSLELLRQWRRSPKALCVLLHLICALLAHRKYAQLFVDLGGVRLLLDLPKSIAAQTTGVSMCLFGLSSIPEALEQTCNLPADVCGRIAALALDHISSGIDPARKNSALFLAEALKYQSILEAFDDRGGPRTILNLLRSSQQFESVRTEAVIAYHLLCVLRSYFRARLTLVVSSIQSSSGGGAGGAPIKRVALNAAKAIDMSSEALNLVMTQVKHDRATSVWFACETWDPARALVDLSGVETLLRFVQPQNIGNYHSETVISVFEVMQMVTLSHEFHSKVEGATAVCGPGRTMEAAEGPNTVETLLAAAAKYRSYSDPGVAVRALEVIVNLVCMPEALADIVSESTGCKSHHWCLHHGHRCCHDSRDNLNGALMESFRRTYDQSRMVVRASNGIKILLELLRNRCHDIQNSETMSFLSLQALLGLAQDPSIAQVLSKLQLPHLLSEMLRDPNANADQGHGPHTTRYSKGSHTLFVHNFRRAALKLIAVLTGTDLAETVSTSDAAVSTLEKIERASIVAATKISYPQRELMQLIHDHLVASGMTETARSLQSEAKLVQGKEDKSEVRNLLKFPNKHHAMKNVKPKSEGRRVFLKPRRALGQEPDPGPEPERSRACAPKRILAPLDDAASPEEGVRPKRLKPSGEGGCCPNAPAPAPAPAAVDMCPVKSKLDSIIMEHLKHQHCECQAPISVLPPFSLMEPHVCPKANLEGNSIENTRPNVACRVLKMQSQAHPRDYKYFDRKFNKHFVHSRFRHMRTLKDDASFTACSFMGNCQQLVVSTDSGDLRILDTFSGDVVDYFDSHAHSSAVHSLRTWQPRNGWPPMLLSAASNDVVLWEFLSRSTRNQAEPS